MADLQSQSLPDADDVADALGNSWVLLAETLETGWSRHAKGVYSLYTGLAAATLNGVWTVCADADADADAAGDADLVRDGLDAVAETGVPHCLQVRPRWKEPAAAIARDRGMTPAGEAPLMAAVQLLDVPVCDELQIRELTRDETALHARLAGPAFDAPPELFAQLITPEVLDLPAVRVYLGEVNGEPVTTALSLRTGDGVGIFDVATPEAHRRRGYGAAITARAADDGFSGGAAWAWLQSSEAGYRVYERLGFSTRERWPMWVTPEG